MIETDDLAFIAGAREEDKDNHWHERWTDEEDKILWNCIFNLHMSQIDTAEKVGRTKGAVEYRWRKLRLANQAKIDEKNQRRRVRLPVEKKESLNLCKFCHSMKPPESVYLGYLR